MEAIKRFVEELDNGCWKWLGPRDSFNKPLYNGKDVLRALYRIRFDLQLPARGSMLVRKCGRPFCVNPDHAERTSGSLGTKRCSSHKSWKKGVRRAKIQKLIEEANN